MERIKHCQLCDNQVMNVISGSTCALTNAKPDFNTTCDRIALNDKFKDKLSVASIELDKLKKVKVLNYTYFIVFMAVSIIVVLVGLTINSWSPNEVNLGKVSDQFHRIQFIIMGVGFLLFTTTLGKLAIYIRDRSNKRRRLNQIEEVLKLYEMEYTLELHYGEEIHGQREVDAKIYLKRTKF